MDRGRLEPVARAIGFEFLIDAREYRPAEVSRRDDSQRLALGLRLAVLGLYRPAVKIDYAHGAAAPFCCAGGGVSDV